jgi:hypothetical protein
MNDEGNPVSGRRDRLRASRRLVITSGACIDSSVRLVFERDEIGAKLRTECVRAAFARIEPERSAGGGPEEVVRGGVDKACRTARNEVAVGWIEMASVTPLPLRQAAAERAAKAAISSHIAASCASDTPRYVAASV